jgi:arabinofuranosyltransferase
MNRPDKNALIKVAGLLIILFSFTLAIASRPFLFVDDAWITFRYAHNLAHHGQLVFNLNERVEGITNLLWAVILAPQIRFIPIPVVTIVIINSLLLTACSLYLIWRIGIFLKFNPIVAALPPSILILTSNFYGTVTNGLEAPLFSFLLACAMYFIVQERHRISSLFFALLFLTRPESLAFGLLFSAILLRPSLKFEHGTGFQIRLGVLQTLENKLDFVIYNAVFLGTVLVTTLLRWMYYHDVIPNSLRAKFTQFNFVLFKEGMNYLTGFMEANPHFVLVGAGVLMVFLMRQAFLFFRTGSFQMGLQSPCDQILFFCFVSILGLSSLRSGEVEIGCRTIDY